MPKHDIDKLLAENPKAARHQDVIKETLSALGKLKDAGLPDPGYNLSPAQGAKVGSKAGLIIPSKPSKMTYCS